MTNTIIWGAQDDKYTIMIGRKVMIVDDSINIPYISAKNIEIVSAEEVDIKYMDSRCKRLDIKDLPERVIKAVKERLEQHD